MNPTGYIAGTCCCMLRGMVRLFVLAVIISIVLSGCDILGSREAKKMDAKIVDPTVEKTDSTIQERAFIPPIDLVDPPLIETATFAMG